MDFVVLLFKCTKGQADVRIFNFNLIQIHRRTRVCVCQLEKKEPKRQNIRKMVFGVLLLMVILFNQMGNCIFATSIWSSSLPECILLGLNRRRYMSIEGAFVCHSTRNDLTTCKVYQVTAINCAPFSFHFYFCFSVSKLKTVQSISISPCSMYSVFVCVCMIRFIWIHRMVQF